MILVGYRNIATGKFRRRRFLQKGHWIPVYIDSIPAYVKALG